MQQPCTGRSNSLPCPFHAAILAMADTQGAGRGAEGSTSFLLVLTGAMPVVTLSSAGRARISLKPGLGAPNPDDLVSLPPALFYRAHAEAGGTVTSGSWPRTYQGGGAKSIFMLLSDTDVSWHLKPVMMPTAQASAARPSTTAVWPRRRRSWARWFEHGRGPDSRQG